MTKAKSTHTPPTEADVLREQLNRIETKIDRQDGTEKLAAWMILNGFATGHGDKVDDLLKELTWQVNELKQQRLNLGSHEEVKPS